jgi:putative membrane protein
MQASQTHAPAHATGLSVWSGVALVTLGVVVNVGAVVRHVTLVRQLRTGTWQAGRISAGAILLALVLAAVGAGMAIYLLLMR